MKKFFQRKEILINRGQYKNDSLESLNKKFDDIINAYTSDLVIKPSINGLSNDLESMKEEVENRLITFRRLVREYDQKHNASIINGTDFDIEKYNEIKDECFRLESLYNTINERLEAMNETIGKKL